MAKRVAGSVGGAANALRQTGGKIVNTGMKQMGRSVGMTGVRKALQQDLARTITNTGMRMGKLGKALPGLAVGATRLATGIGAVTLVTEGLTMALGYFLDNTEAINAAIQAGDVEKAEAEARQQNTTMAAIDVAGGCLLYTSPSPRDRG